MTGQPMHTSEWHIRPARADDLEFLLSLTPRLAHGFELPPGREAGEIVQVEGRALAEALDRPTADTALLVAERPGGDRAGIVYVQQQVDYFRQRAHALVAILAVGAELEGQGAGRALLDAAEAWARGQGFDMITLHVFAGNARARAVYVRQGYAPETVRYLKWL